MATTENKHSTTNAFARRLVGTLSAAAVVCPSRLRSRRPRP